MLKRHKLFECVEGDQIAYQLTRYAYMKKVQKLFFIITSTKVVTVTSYYSN